MSATWRLLRLVAALLCLGPLYASSSFPFQCELDQQPIVLVEYNDTTGEFSLAAVDEDRRILEKGDIPSQRWSLRQQFSFGLFASDGGRGSQHGDNVQRRVPEDTLTSEVDNTGTPQDEEVTFYARKCECVPELDKVYCPVVVDQCSGTIVDGVATNAICYEKTSGYGSFAMMAFVSYCVTVGVISIFVRGGGLCYAYIYRTRPNEEAPEPSTAPTRNPNNAQRIAELLAALESVTSPRPPTTPTQLALRTRIFHRQPEGSNDTEMTPEMCSIRSTEEDESCAICFVSFREGDRVGLVPCDHLFHVECLKSWLPRRNACPLCQEKNIAVPITTRQGSADDREA